MWQLLCYLQSVFGVGTGTVAVSVVSTTSPLPYGADEVDIVYSGAFISTATYKKAGVTVKTATCTNDGTNITKVIYS